MKGRGGRIIFDLLVCCDDEEPCLFSSGGENGCMFEMHQTGMVLIVLAVGIHAFLLEHRGKVFFPRKA